MPKREKEEWPEASWTSMIDIIFQLLIFFMVTLSLGKVEQRAHAATEGIKKEDIPELPGMKNLGDALDITPGTILIHVERDKKDEVPGEWIVFLLTSKIQTIKDARSDTARTAGPFSWDFAFKKISNELQFKRQYNEPLPRIEMRAESVFPYGNVLDVMKMCYHDEEKQRINQVFFRLAKTIK